MLIIFLLTVFSPYHWISLSHVGICMLIDSPICFTLNSLDCPGCFSFGTFFRNALFGPVFWSLCAWTVNTRAGNTVYVPITVPRPSSHLSPALDLKSCACSLCSTSPMSPFVLTRCLCTSGCISFPPELQSQVCSTLASLRRIILCYIWRPKVPLEPLLHK